MIPVTGGVRIVLYRGASDLRRGFDGLCGHPPRIALPAPVLPEYLLFHGLDKEPALFLFGYEDLFIEEELGFEGIVMSIGGRPLRGDPEKVYYGLDYGIPVHSIPLLRVPYSGGVIQ